MTSRLLYSIDRQLGYGVSMRPIRRVGDYEAGPLNVLDHGILRESNITPGERSADAGRAAREYVISAAKAALEGDIAAMVTLPIKQGSDAVDRS